MFQFLFSNRKDKRTTLIPKAKKDVSKAENWWPITVGAILSRIFSSIFGGRIKGGTVRNLRQKGFTSENGCKINVGPLTLPQITVKRTKEVSIK